MARREKDQHQGTKSTIGERLTGIYDPKDPDGLLTVDRALTVQDTATYGTEEKDTLDLETADEEARPHARD